MMLEEQLAQDLLKAMRETHFSSLAAGLSSTEAWDKATVRADARCKYLLKKHPTHVVDAAVEIFAAHLEAKAKAEEKP